MFNLLTLAGPTSDPADARNATNATDAFRRIHDARRDLCEPRGPIGHA